MPSPERQDVQLKRQPGGHFAAIMFNGVADEDQVSTEVALIFSFEASPYIINIPACFVQKWIEISCCIYGVDTEGIFLLCHYRCLPI